MASELGPWARISPTEAARLLAPLEAPWWIAGGWAIDIFLGRRTREHEDMDISILRHDQPALADAFRGWDVQVACEATLTPWRPGDWLEGGRRHQFWARPTPRDPWLLEFLLEESDGDEWVFRREHEIRLPLARFGGWMDELPCVAPVVALLYKGTSSRRASKDEDDFTAALPRLGADARDWLRWTLTRVQPGHPWADRLQR